MNDQSILSFEAARKKLLEGRQFDKAAELEADELRRRPGAADVLHKHAWTLAALGRHSEALAAQYEAANSAKTEFYYTVLASRAQAEARRARGKRLTSFHDGQNSARRMSRLKIETILKSAKESWRFWEGDALPPACEALSNNIIDSVPDWIEFGGHEPVNAGGLVSIDGIGDFIVRKPQSVIGKRLSRGVPWELPVAVFLQELARRTKSSSVIIEVGANIGSITVPLALNFQGRIIAFEPVSVTAEELVINLQQNNIDNVEVRMQVCSSAAIPYKMVGYDDNNPGLARAEFAGEEADKLYPSAVKLDDLREEISAPVAVIKIDVEGHESEVIGGAQNIIMTDRPIIVVELFESEKEKFSSEMKLLGYEGYHLFRSDWVFVPR